MAFAESDWKRLRQLRSAALDRFCNRILEEIASTSTGPGTSHERYLKIFDLIQHRDKELGRMFDALSRSNAFEKILMMRRAGLFTDEEWSSFSEDIRTAFARTQEYRRKL